MTPQPSPLVAYPESAKKNANGHILPEHDKVLSSVIDEPQPSPRLLGFTLHRLTEPAHVSSSDLTFVILGAFRSPTGPDAEPNDRDSEADSQGRRVLAQRLSLPSPVPSCKYALPSYLLYDARGLQLFDELTRLPDNEYYLTKHEADLLSSGGVAEQVAAWIEPGAVVVELGCGSMRKTKVILDAIELAASKPHVQARFAKSPVKFYALDMDAGELEKSLSGLVANPPHSSGWRYISFHGLIGTYFSLMHSLPPCTTRRLILWLGSSIGNLTRSAAASFLTSLRTSLDPRDRLLLGVDGRNPADMIERAYNDSHGVTREFELNILRHVNTYLDPKTHLDVDKFEYAGVYNTHVGRHESYLRAVDHIDMTIRAKGGKDNGDEVRVQLAQGDLIHIEHSYKYNTTDMANLAAMARWSVDATWGDGVYSMYLLSPVEEELGGFVFNPTTAGEQGVPSVHEWEQVWRAFDMMSLKLVKREAWEVRPIEVRLPVCFYVGHLPCFADIQLSRALNLPLLAPPRYTAIFERGMDPDLDDPTHCHAHSEIPDKWPAMSDICAYRDSVRDRIRTLTRTRQDMLAHSQEARDVLCLVFEHDVMHLETLMYLIAQFPTDMLHDVASVGLPTASVRLVGQAGGPLPPATTRVFPSTHVVLGRKREDGGMWGWDNEFPEHDAQDVGPLEVQARQVSVGEYATFLDAQGGRPDLVPAGWTKDERGTGWQVRSIAHNTFLSVSNNDEHVANWPVCVSKVMALAYTEWMNRQVGPGQGQWRLPTEHELRMVYDCAPFVDPLTTGFSGMRLAPVPMTGATFAYAGNVWEWTSSLFKAHAGFEPDARYPGYSADFFDHKHSVVLGASWATHPRLARRSGFRNWFQDGYPYAQIGFRLVRLKQRV